MDLKDTVEMMLSSDYKERFKAEYIQLDIRLKKLRTMLDKYNKGELDFTPDCSSDLLEYQYETMKRYMLILKQRAEIEGIVLE